MNLFELATDPEKDSKGTWIEYPDKSSNGSGKPAEFLIASINSKEYKKALNAEVKKRFHRKWTTDVEGREEAEIFAMAKAVLLDWRGDVYLEKSGQVTPFSREAALKALYIPAFKAWIESEASTLENFQNEEKAADMAALKSGTEVGAAVRQA